MNSTLFTPERAARAVKAVAAEAASDPARPLLHFTPPSGWMNDPNGTIFHAGWYHLFYQHHPYSADWKSMHWGHARSRDLVHWEHRPVALCPQVECGENHCFSGGATIRFDGVPMILYTSIGDRLPEQWLALGSSDLDTWQRHPANPVMTTAIHEGLEVSDWRDPFFFSVAGRTCLVLGGRADGSPAVLLYELAANDGTAWRYRGILYRHSDPAPPSLECPNFFPVGDRWVLCFSVKGTVAYVAGTLAPESGEYRVDVHGNVDLTENFYASNICRDDRGRTILFGWVRGFSNPTHWNGALSIPREVTLAADGTLRQKPVVEWERLRGPGQRQDRLRIGNSAYVLCEAGTAWELDWVCRIPVGASLTLRLRRNDTGESLWAVCFSGADAGEVSGVLRVPVSPGQACFRVRLFLDRTVAELFAGDGASCATRVLQSGGAAITADVQADGGEVFMERLETWSLG